MIVIFCFTALLVSVVLGQFALYAKDDYAIDECRSCMITSGAGILFGVSDLTGIAWLIFLLTVYMLGKVIRRSF